MKRGKKRPAPESSWQRVVDRFHQIKRTFQSRQPRSVSHVYLTWCAKASDHHAKDPRAYMHVGHDPHAICAAGDSADLADGYLYGLFLHEFGHLFTPGGTEQDADRAAFEITGIPIIYKGRLKLEWADPKAVLRAISR